MGGPGHPRMAWVRDWPRTERKSRRVDDSMGNVKYAKAHRGRHGKDREMHSDRTTLDENLQIGNYEKNVSIMFYDGGRIRN